MTLERIEGHLKWIKDMEPIIQRNAKDGLESLETYCARLFRNNGEAANADEHLNQNQDDEVDEDLDLVRVSWTEKATIFAQKLNAVASSVLTGNTENAERLLGTLDQLMEDLVDSTDNQCQMILYCMDVLRWQIGGGVDDEEAERLNWKWEELIESNEGMATVCFLKGMCGLGIKVEDKAVEEYYLKATELDPNCLVWYHHAYRSLRRRRGRGGMQGGPSKKEVELARTAYQLCNGEDTVSVTNFGVTLKEILWTKRRKTWFWRKNSDIYLECVQVFKNALQIATNTKWRMTNKLYLAEFLCFGCAPEEDKMRGREMLFELERDYPKDLAVLHKVGNLYRDDGIVQRARNCYRQALDIHPTMVPCIMDYLRMLKENREKNAFLRNRAKAEIAKVLDKALSPEYVRSDKDTEKLRDEQRELENWA